MKLDHIAEFDWADDSKDKLRKMFAEARTKRLWFNNSSLAGTFWFSPDELQAEQEAGKFHWGAVNWKLRDPKDRIRELSDQIAAAQKEIIEMHRRIG